jgi:hypothetical protein
LGPETGQFSIFLKARDNFDHPADLNFPNEVILAAWPVSISEQLPLEAFFYVDSPAGLVEAQYMQRDYFEQTGNYLPVIRLTIGDKVFNFSYHEDDQDVSSSGP